MKVRRRSSPGGALVAVALALLVAVPLGVPAALSSVGDGAEPFDDTVASTLTLAASGTEVQFAGDFDDGSAARLGAFLDDHPDVVRIRFRSDGGLVDEAEAIGDLVAARGLTTVVTEHCISACTLAFAHGRERLLSRGAKLGFHAPYSSDALGRDVAVNSEAEKRAYVATGIDVRFVDEALGVPFTEIWIPDPSRLIDARIVTALIEPEPAGR